MEYDPRVSAACDELRAPCKYGSRIVRPNVLITWWTYDGESYSAVATGPAGRSIVKSSTHCFHAQSIALAAYLRGHHATTTEETEWSTR